MKQQVQIRQLEQEQQPIQQLTKEQGEFKKTVVQVGDGSVYLGYLV
jgi:hypothetical protein